MIKINQCIFCGKELTKKQINKRSNTCSRECNIKYKMLQNQNLEPDFFEIDNQDILYYLLGLLYTDGNLDKTKNIITLSLTDKTIITSLYPYFSANKRKIYEYQPKNINAHKAYTIINKSDKAISKLINMGFSPCNSLTKTFPQIPNEYFGSFLRGIFDGDGCVYISNTIKGKKYYSISITCASYEFVLSLKEKLEDLKFNPTLVIDSRRKDNINKTYYLKLNKQKEVKNFMNYIYKDCNIKNNTKYEKYYYENIV